MTDVRKLNIERLDSGEKEDDAEEVTNEADVEQEGEILCRVVKIGPFLRKSYKVKQKSSPADIITES